jgi:hypothetical protein
MPRDGAYDPFGQARMEMPRPAMNVKDPMTQEPVEDFRLTDEMRGFSSMFKKILGMADYIQKGVFSAAAEFQKRRNVFADVVGTLTNLSTMFPKNKLVGLNRSFGEATEEYNEEATRHATEEPFSSRGLIDVLGQRGELTESAYKMRK